MEQTLKKISEDLVNVINKVDLTYPYIGSAKKFFQVLIKNKTHFPVSSRTLLNNVFTILFHYFLPFFPGNFIIPSFQIFNLFE